MKDSIEITMDSAGRIVIPKSLRQLAGFRPRVRLRVRYREGRIEIETAPRPIHIEKKGGLSVAVTREDVSDVGDEVLTDHTVNDTLDRLRNRNEE